MNTPNFILGGRLHMLACEHGAMECGVKGIIMQVWPQTSWAHLLPLPLTDCETLSQVLNLSFVFCKMGYSSTHWIKLSGRLDDLRACLFLSWYTKHANHLLILLLLLLPIINLAGRGPQNLRCCQTEFKALCSWAKFKGRCSRGTRPSLGLAPGDMWKDILPRSVLNWVIIIAADTDTEFITGDYLSSYVN